MYDLLARLARTLKLRKQTQRLERKTANPEAVRRLRQPRPLSGARLEQARRFARWHAALPRVPTPGGWPVPSEVIPAWNWTPPPGITPRLDRVPRWVRIWYYTPFADRYAHAWMWRHGGFDVVPPAAWAPAFEEFDPQPPRRSPVMCSHEDRCRARTPAGILRTVYELTGAIGRSVLGRGRQAC
jgi:hypothetical protein